MKIRRFFAPLVSVCGRRQAIPPDAVLNPEGLPECGTFSSGPCNGDGTTLKERLQALPTVGEVTVTGMSSTFEIVGDGAEICGIDAVRPTAGSTALPTLTDAVYSRRSQTARAKSVARTCKTIFSFAGLNYLR